MKKEETERERERNIRDQDTCWNLGVFFGIAFIASERILEIFNQIRVKRERERERKNERERESERERKKKH